MDFKSYLKEKKQEVDSFLVSYIEQKAKENEHINKWTKDFADRLAPFVVNGKTLRGGVVCFAYDMYSDIKTDIKSGTGNSAAENNWAGKGTANKGNKTSSSDAIKAAAAVELMHSSLLIHDDIMDRDALRRGKETIYSQYASLAQKKGFATPDHFGIGMGLCVGDIGFFLTFELLTELECNAEVKARIIKAYAKELSSVAIAQMQDFASGFSKEKISEKEIMGIYKYKSAHYTYSLPLMMGALIANAPESEIKKLERLGESLGILFQIKDDELGLFGDEQEVGKPIGSDIKEGKQTLYHFHLFSLCDPGEREKLHSIFGRQDITTVEVEYVRECVKQKGIQKKVEGIMQTLGEESRKRISGLQVSDESKQILLDIVEHGLKRRK